jgi:hypothetical protein
MDDRLRPSRTPFGFSPEAAVWLAERVAAGFEPSAGMIDFTAAPFSEVTYAYRARPAARIALDGLPESMRDELLWWLCSLHAGGERVNSWSLLGWVRVAVTLAGDPTRGVCSFAGLAVEEWIVAGRRQFYDRHGRLPGAWFEHNHRAAIARLCVAVQRACGAGEWWRADVWEPRRDPRIPVREHEALGNARLRFAEISQPWLREAIKWFFACALEQGVLAWSTLPGYRTYLGSYFSQFLLEAGIDHPRLVSSETELRAVNSSSLGGAACRCVENQTCRSCTQRRLYVCRLVHVDGLTYAEAAERAGLTARRVRVLVSHECDRRELEQFKLDSIATARVRAFLERELERNPELTRAELAHRLCVQQADLDRQLGYEPTRSGERQRRIGIPAASRLVIALAQQAGLARICWTGWPCA